MAEAGRNDPCPCGSGKKYKHCCLARSYPAVGPEESIKERLVQEILAFCRRRFGAELDRAADEFWQEFVPEDHLDEKDLEMPEINFWEWVVFDWQPDDKNEKGMIDLYREASASRLTREENKVLDVMKNASLSLYEVQEVFPEQGFLLKDLYLGGDFDVREKMATRVLLRWDIFAARLLNLDGKFTLSGAVYPYVVKQKGPILEAIQKGFKEFKKDFPGKTKRDYLKLDSTMFNFYWFHPILNPPKIKLSTTTGERFVFSRAVFKIVDRERAIRGLAAVQSFHHEKESEFVWLQEGGKIGDNVVLGKIEVGDRYLVLECNSEKRLKAGKKLILRALRGEKVQHVSDITQDPFQAMKSYKGKDESNVPREIPPEVFKDAHAQFMKKFYTRWLDESIPALGGKTPREAVRTKKGREQVADLLKSLENLEENKKRRGELFYDFTWMWKELKLEREG